MATLGSMLDWSSIIDALEAEAEELEAEALEAETEQEQDYVELEREWADNFQEVEKAEVPFSEDEEWPTDAEFLADALESLSTALLYGNWEDADRIAETLEDVTGALNSFEIDVVQSSIDAYYDALEAYTHPEPEPEPEPEQYEPAVSAFDYASQVGYLHELAETGDISREDFESLASELYDGILDDISSSDPLLANSLWDDLVGVESYLRGETLGIGWDAEGAAVFTTDEWREASGGQEYNSRGTFGSELDAQAWIAEIGVDAFVIVESDDGFSVIEIGTGGGRNE